MMTDRKKAILYLTLTFLAGLIIGTLVPPLVGKIRHGRGGPPWREQGSPRGHGHAEGRYGWVEGAIMRIVKPDSSQAEEIRKAMADTRVKVESLEKSSSERMVMIVDSLEMRLKPVLSQDQFDRLHEFNVRVRERGRRSHRP